MQCRASNPLARRIKGWSPTKKNVPPPLLLPYMPQQPKGKARNNSTPHPPLPLPFQWPGLSLWQVPPYFLSIISPPFAHPHRPACHCGRSRLSTNFPNSLPSHLYTQPSVIPTFKARLVIVAGPASSVSPPTSSSPSLPSFSLSGFHLLRHMTRLATVASLTLPPAFFFLIAGCIGSLGYWQSLATRESKTQHQWYCVPKRKSSAHTMT